VTGCILSNELLDNFAIHQVVMDNELKEVFVDYNQGFKEVLMPASDKLKDYLDELHIILPKGYRTEINLEATEWIAGISRALNKGYVMTIDYGYPSSELYKEYRSTGTLLCYNNHRINDCPYQDIGKQDITAHVNFSALYYWGQKNGLDCTGFTNQAQFLLSLGLKDQLAAQIANCNGDGYSSYLKNAHIVNKLLIEMGNKFKVLIQQKGMPQVQLRGLKLALPDHIMKVEPAALKSA
jgi:SAM-dependent MidA family methyltransferase